MMARAKARTTQTTQAGHEIPIPSRDAVMRDLGKLAQGPQPEKVRHPRKAEKHSTDH